ncbi:MAG: DMT family transporter [Boseongicola sp.]
MANTRAILLMTAAMAAFAISDAFINRAAETLPTGQILAITCALGFIPFLFRLRKTGERLFSANLWHHAVLVRTIGEVLGSLGYVMALSLVPLATASAMLQAQPLAVTMAAAIILGERVGPRRWAAVGLGFVGVLMIIRPGAEAFDPNVLWALLGIAGLTARDLGTRLLPKEISTPFVSFWALFLLSLLGLAIMPVDGVWRQIEGLAWFWLIGCSVSVAFAIVAITAALRIGEISAIAPFRYTRMVFALAIAILLLGESPDAMTWAGTALIVGSGIYAFWRERTLAQS